VREHRSGIFLATALTTGLWLTSAPGLALAQTVSLHVDRRGDMYAGMPFVLSVAAEGFAENPEPKVSGFAIAGADVHYLGMSPNVSSSIVIVNGKRTESHHVSFVFRYRVLARKAGTYQIPAITVTQGGRSAGTRAASFTAREIADSAEMKLRLVIPERSIWVGETFEAAIDLYLRQDPQQPVFSIPLFDQEGKVDIRAPEAKGEKTLAFAVGGKEVELPYTSERAKLDGVEYTRFRFRALATPRAPGNMTLEPARVVAALAIGRDRDAFGFSVATTSIFKAEDRQRTLEVRPLPLADRPASFAGAVGSSFSIGTQANRTVVRVGDPIELAIIIRGDTDLTGLSAPPLPGTGAFPSKWFDVPKELPAGELADAGKSKRFRVTLRLKSTEAREIPAVAFSYFDPVRGKYATVHSEPIALAVEGSAVVGAGEVVSTVRQGEKSEPTAAPGAVASPSMALVGADFSLSDATSTLSTVASTRDLWPLLLLLYAGPLAVFGLRSWQIGSRGRRGRASARRARLRALKDALREAQSAPARESAPRIANAFRELARLTERSDARDPALTRLETEAFDPRAAASPLAPELLDQLDKLAAAWAEPPAPPGRSKSARLGSSSLLAIAVLQLGSSGACSAGPSADPPPQAEISAARAAYEAALSQQERSARRLAFAQAERLFRNLAAAQPEHPELLTDWGNAALGAGELGWAALAYRRALILSPALDRARRNLAWVEQRLPAWASGLRSDGALGSLFFWQRSLSAAARQLLAASLFCLAVLLCIRWGRGGRTALLRRLAVAPLLLWLAILASALVARDGSAEAVVVSDVVLRSADSAGAAPALSDLIPAGAQVEIREPRGDWTRVLLPNGVEGWLRASAIEAVAPPAAKADPAPA
jgi:hypothetical protein